MTKTNIGMIGLGVMGANLARNIVSRGYRCAVYNRTPSVTAEFMAKFGQAGFVPAETLEAFVGSLASPRQIFVMVQAGKAVDLVLEGLLPLLSRGDIVIDAGNSHFTDTVRRETECKAKGIFFLGVGVSGGEDGALNGPSIMPGGAKEAWQVVAPLLEKISAKADGPCTAYVGPGGAGHFVKMVHNGIEYGDMQLIAEAYHILKDVIDCRPEELADIFADWNKGALQSYLIEITSNIFRKRDELGQGFLVDAILDKAGQKGTGRWTAETALDLAVSIPTISAAVDARVLSSIKDERQNAAKEFPKVGGGAYSGDRKKFIKTVHDALYCSKVMSYAQGMALMQAASRQWSWDLKLDEIAALWKGGCIIRARFLDEIRQAFARNRGLQNLILDSEMKRKVAETSGSLRTVIAAAAQAGVPVLGFSASLAYYDSYRTADLPQNLTQAQRDFFGAHTYERKDRAGTFHTVWE